MNARLERAVDRARDLGVLPPDATPPGEAARPWPVVLLTGLGAWLAALPIMVVVFMALGDHLMRGIGPYVVGTLLVAGAIGVLRVREVPLFIEQIAVPALLAGGIVLGLGLFDGLHARGGAAAVALLAILIALAIPQPWLRVLWGGAAATLAGIALIPGGAWQHAAEGTGGFWLAVHGLFALWLLAVAAQRGLLNDGSTAPFAEALESTASGWILVTLAGLALASGMTFLAGGAINAELANEITREAARQHASGARQPLTQSVSVALAVGGAAAAARAWPSLRQPAFLGVAAVLTVLAWFLPSLGAVLLALALLATTGRALTAAAATLAATWIVGSFYYQLQWTLSTKAAVLAGAGALLALLAWIGWLPLRGRDGEHRRDASAADTDRAPPPIAPRVTLALIAFCALATLAAVNAGIWQKERLIATGERMYVELVPVDPRSLMQGDYMRLSFRLPAEAQAGSDLLGRHGRPKAVGARDARGVTTFSRLDRDGGKLAPGEIRVELTPKDGRWILVTDAWFFREGDGPRWAAARYGEFRVTPDGQALLVGMADADLKPISP